MKEENKEYDGEPITLAEVFGKNNSLSDKRSKWVNKWCHKKLTGRAIAELKQQDKEFIKELKEEIQTKGYMNTGINIAFRDWVYEKIDKIFGDKLTK